MDIQSLIDSIAHDVEPYLAQGKPADYIPALAMESPQQFAMAVATLDGAVYTTGLADKRFSIQSISKAFMLAHTLRSHGEALWQRVGKEPSGNPFNSLVQLEYEHGIPRNPFINAGALVVTDIAISEFGDSSSALRSFLREECGEAAIDFDYVIAASEAEHGHRNAALGHFMKSCDNIRNGVEPLLAHYFRACSIRMNVRELARAGLFLANHGISPVSSQQRLSRSQAKQINAIMLTCGTYDAAGEFAYRVGLPCKSGVGGGILAILPGKMSIAVWSPGLDARGNSLAGLEALDRFTTRSGESVF
ncbi:glutaminase [Vogesella oryzae]|uniref:glutaminase n=1 Tax=Vogesella oryzae TaxID=1735285 RepID=UPI0015836D08|nr:glutaminase [Vogesella oryzae]